MAEVDVLVGEVEVEAEKGHFGLDKREGDVSCKE